MLAAIEMSSFSSVVMSWSFSCPWILVTNSFLSSSHVSARNPILMVKLASAFVLSDKSRRCVNSGPTTLFFIFVPPLSRGYLEVEVWYYLQGLGTLCVPNHVDYSDMILSLWKKIHKFLRSVSKSKKTSQSQKSSDGLTEPQLFDWLASWCCPMPSPSGDISNYNIIKLMIILGELTYWSIPKNIKSQRHMSF
jgi:hypothetical protein